MRTLPDLGCLFDERADIRNIPRIVAEDNVFFTSSQINISAAASASAKTDGNNLRSDLDKAGGNHQDINDHPSSYTTMYASSDIPDDVHPGHFFFLGLGCFVKLINFRPIIMGGWDRHSGQSPRSTSSEVPTWATRVTHIWYPTAGIMERSKPIQLATIGSYIQETNGPHDLGEHPRADRNCLSYIRDGLNVMEPSSHRKFVVREILMMLMGIINQLGDEDHLRLDVPTFMSAFKYKDAGGVEHSMEAWELAPHFNSSVINADSVMERRAQIQSQLRLLSARYDEVIPGRLPVELRNRVPEYPLDGKSDFIFINKYDMLNAFLIEKFLHHSTLMGPSASQTVVATVRKDTKSRQQKVPKNSVSTRVMRSPKASKSW